MKTFSVHSKAKIYVYPEPIHMFASFKRLTQLVEDDLKQKPGDGDVFLFVNVRCDYLKALYWHQGGFCIFAKKLDAGKFKLNLARKSMSLSAMTELIEDVVRIEEKAA